uniref:C-type lectin domain-containing protein n=1 Tax=Panagrolaimus sp. ES5 TaxID=591445 RepID=A0AC34FMK4_9BILA
MCYKKVLTTLTAENAEAECKKEGGNLVSIHSEEEAEFIISLHIPLRGAWIGLKKDPVFFLWSWTDGTAMDYKRWSDKPTDEKNPENYARVDWGGDWNYATPGAELPFFCKKNAFHHKKKSSVTQ